MPVPLSTKRGAVTLRSRNSEERFTWKKSLMLLIPNSVCLRFNNGR